MRIIAGEFKGARLFAPKSRLIRPTSDRVREYIFSCIQQKVRGKSVIDLFAGTGALGIEASSRGAADVAFVDSSKEAVEVLRRNLAKTGVEAVVHKRSVESFLKSTPVGRSFDFVFCDPPYSYDRFEKLLELIHDKGLLRRGGYVIYESDSRRDAPNFDKFTIVRQKVMGDTKITFYRYDYVNDSDLSGNI